MILISFMKKEAVFCAAFLCALISSFIVPPSKEYISYIDFDTLYILFALMAVVASLRSCGLFDLMAKKICARFHSVRGISAVCIFLCFFSGMLITNDVALLTFVPLAISLLMPVAPPSSIMITVVLQTVAANTGSMLTPLGNPQNLFLFQQTGSSILSFMYVMLPYTLISALFLVLCLFLIPAGRVNFPSSVQPDSSSQGTRAAVKKAVSILLFMLCILSVLRFVPKYVTAIAVAAVLLVMDWKILLKPDYMLLLTFCAFFVFTGNIARIPRIKELLEGFVSGREVLASCLSSQVISNVPATLLLYPFTESSMRLLIGVNIGGLGTLVASLASLISYKIYAKALPANPSLPKSGRYLAVFTAFNAVLLLILAAFAAAF